MIWFRSFTASALLNCSSAMFSSVCYPIIVGKTPKAFANFSPGFERRENPGVSIKQGHLNPERIGLCAVNHPKELNAALRSYPKSFLDKVSTGSDSDLV